MDGELIGRDSRVRRSEISGVTVYWSDDAPRRMANLSFRTGRSDEPFTKTGVNHLIEHLAMFGVGRVPYPANAYVDHVRTAFHAQADEDELVRHIADISRMFSNLPFERLQDEARILRTESVNHSPNLPLQFLWHRYGARGHGMLAIPEVGLPGLTPDHLAEWSATRFTAGNAAAWFGGVPPDDLRFELPPGPRLTTVPRVPIEPLPLPCWIATPLPGIALGLIVERSTPAMIGLRILTDRLERRLRYDLGLSYEVSLAYIPLDAEVAQASIYASAQEADVRLVRDAFVDVIHRLLDQGPAQDDLDRDVDGFRRSLEDPDRVLGELDAAVRNDLVGHPVETFAEVLERARAATREEVRMATVRAVSESMLAGPLLDEPTRSGDRTWARYPLSSPQTVDGRHFDTASRRFPWQPRKEELIVGEEGVSWRNADGQANTVLYRECVGMLATEGVRILYGVDGFLVRILGSHWRTGDRAIEMVDAAIPADLVVWSDRPGPATRGTRPR